MRKDMTMKSVVIIILSLIFCLSLVAIGWAQYPTRPINYILGYPIGGIAATVSRPICDAASKILGQPIVTIYKPGAATAVSLSLLKNEKPDGYTIGYLTGSSILMPHWGSVSYSIIEDFTPIIKFMEITLYGVAVRADSPWKTFKELVDYVKANPGKVKYATPGVGSVHHLALESFAKEAEIKWTHVPCKGGAEAVTALLGGHVDIEGGTPEWKPYVETGRLRLLANFGPKRSLVFPDVPTLLDMGYKAKAASISVVAGPKGLPKPIVDKLHMAFKEAMNDTEFIKIVKIQDQEISYNGPEGTAKEIKELNDLYKKLVAEFGSKKE